MYSFAFSMHLTASSVTLINHNRNLIILHIPLCLTLKILSVLEYCLYLKHLFRPFCCYCLNPGHHHILSGEQVSNLVLLFLDPGLTIHPLHFCHTDFIFYYPSEKLSVSPHQLDKAQTPLHGTKGLLQYHSTHLTLSTYCVYLINFSSFRAQCK